MLMLVLSSPARTAPGGALDFGGPVDDIVRFLHARLNEDAEAATAAALTEGLTGSLVDFLKHEAMGVDVAPSEAHYGRHTPARVLAEVEAKRRILDLHTPEWTTVEWPDDQNGKGEAQVCRSCGNRDIDQWLNWRRRYGEHGEFPEGVKPPYIVAPCTTLRLIALPYADHPGYRAIWRP